jgi:hypothetical protein
MEATGGESDAVAPSKALLKVRQCFPELDAVSAEEAPAQPTQDAAQIIAAVAVGGISGLVSALQCWHDNPNNPLLEEYSQVAHLEPRFELGEATLDVLLEFYEMRGSISSLWQGRSPPAKTTLLPLLFQFFGFYWADFVASETQLYYQAVNLKKQLKKLSPDDREIHLHSVCFEKAPVKRRTAVSTASSSDGDLQQMADRDDMIKQRRRLELATARIADRRRSLDAAYEVLTADRKVEEQQIEEQHKMALQGQSLRTAELEEELSQRDMDLDETRSKLQDLDYEKSRLVLTTTSLQAQVMIHVDKIIIIIIIIV